MRVAILEWICSTYRGFPYEEHLLEDGRAMLGTLLKASIMAGNKTATLISDRLDFPTPNGRQALDRSGYRVHRMSTDDQPENTFEAAIISKWQEFAAEHDCAIIVAPEVDGLLERVVAAVSRTSRVLNCTGDALALCSDKLALSLHLGRFSIQHPKTWIASHFESSAEPEFQIGQQYVVKPRRGAGCYQLRLFTAVDWTKTKRDCTAEDRVGADASLNHYVVQEFVQGDAYSQSVLIGTGYEDPGLERTIEILRPCKQTVTLVSGGAIELSGLSVVDEVPQANDLEMLMQELINSLPKHLAGWIGVDLVFSKSLGKWFVIEVNPRCTASIDCLWRAAPTQVAALFRMTATSS